MKEFEKHIVNFSKQLGCSFADEETRLEQWTTEDCFEFLTKCLWKINPEIQQKISSWKLPAIVTARFAKATEIADAVKSIGIRREFGYQTLLYGGLADLIPLFLDLIEKIPKEEHYVEETKSVRDQLLSQACSNIQPTWVPEFCRRLMLRYDGRFWCPSEEFPEYVSPFQDVDYRKALEAGDDSRKWIAALLRIGGLGSSGKLYKLDSMINAKPRPAPKPKFKPELPPKPKFSPKVANDTESRMAEKRAKLEKLRGEIDEKKMDIIEIKCQQVFVEDKILPLESEMAGLDEKWLTLLENPVEGQERLQKVLNESAAKFERLEGKWRTIRDEKTRYLEELKTKYSSTLEVENLRVKAQTARNKRKALIEETQGKEQYIERLKRRLEKLESEDCNRGMFTKRITEIMNNIKKQREEMDKVNKDILGLHKEIRWLSQAVERTFGVIEEQLYREANESYKGERSYKLFSKVHACCQKAMHCIERSGQLAKNVEELTDQAEIGRQSTVDSRLHQVLTDLEAVETEKERLEGQVKEFELKKEISI